MHIAGHVRAIPTQRTCGTPRRPVRVYSSDQTYSQVWAYGGTVHMETPTNFGTGVAVLRGKATLLLSNLDVISVHQPPIKFTNIVQYPSVCRSTGNEGQQ